MFEQLPQGVFQIVLGHLPKLADQKSVALTSKRFSQWAYRCQMWCVTKPKELATREKTAKTYAEKVALVREKRSTRVEVEKQSTLLGRTLFSQVVNNPNGPLDAIRRVKGKTVGEHLLNVLRHFPDIFDKLPDAISNCMQSIKFMEAYEQGKMETYISENREKMVKDFKYKHYKTKTEPDDKALLEFALEKAKETVELDELKDRLARFMYVKEKFMPTNLPLPAPDSPTSSLSNSPGTPGKG